jgi:hypothetical protein
MSSHEQDATSCHMFLLASVNPEGHSAKMVSHAFWGFEQGRHMSYLAFCGINCISNYACFISGGGSKFKWGKERSDNDGIKFGEPWPT